MWFHFLAGGGRGQAHESLHQHDREEALQHHTLHEQPGQLQVRVAVNPHACNPDVPPSGPEQSCLALLEAPALREESPRVLSPCPLPWLCISCPHLNSLHNFQSFTTCR